MLYERWRQIVRERGGECALRELFSGRQWTFAEMARLAEGAPAASQPMAFPRGHDAGFVFAVLQAWRSKAVVCPLEADQTTAPVVSLPPAGCIHLKTTSATTGAPRFVAFTAEQLAADAENIAATMGLRPDWPNVAAISLAHSYGFSNLVLPLLLHGIPLVIAPSPLPEIFRQAIDRAEIPDLTLPAVPALWRAWHAAGVIPANVRLAISAGAPLPLALETGIFSATGIKIHNFYGSSECGGIAYDAAPAPRTEESCAGKAMRNVDLQIGEAGCLEVRGKAVGETYWPTPSSALKAGCFKTSDLGEIINGEVHLRGRLADQINVAGRKVSPAVIEQSLLEHEQVAECLAFGVPSADADRAEVIVACIVAKSPVAGEELKQFLLRRIPAWQVPREWWFVDSVAGSRLGKVSRAQWRQDFLNRKRPLQTIPPIAKPHERS
jgi:acyl-coenzyme A synthetase/AMP-(fatty) acid ligase